MPHAPFIIATYAITAVLLTWCALAPVIQIRKLKQAILQRNKTMENENAPNA